jgi:predicted MPP superfamily phosphohydrolase
VPRVLEYMKQYPQVRVLDDEKIDLWNGIEIIWVDYRNSFDRNQYNQTIQDLQASPDKFSIFLYHEPKRVEDTATVWKYDIQLYWHTHGWQLYPWPRIIKAIYGVYGYGLTLIDWLDTRVYTTSGVGLFGPNIRLGTQNEIVRVTINPWN